MAIYGIKAVKYCLSKNLLHYVEADAGGGQTQDIEVFNPATGQCTVTNPLTVLPCLVGSKATLTVDDAVVNRRHQYTARLTFVTADNPNLDGEYYAFVVETNEGEQMLLGSKVAPRCSVTTRQNVAATAGDINGYTTTVDFKAPYAPLRLPVTTEPVTDTREFDICCGAIAQPQQPDTREFDVCCGQIAQPPVPDTREFDVCCGEIQGEVQPVPHDDEYWYNLEPDIEMVNIRPTTSEEVPDRYINYFSAYVSLDNIMFAYALSCKTDGALFYYVPNPKYFYINVDDLKEYLTPTSFDAYTGFDKLTKDGVQVGIKEHNLTPAEYDGSIIYFMVDLSAFGNILYKFWVWLSFDGVTLIPTLFAMWTGGASAPYIYPRFAQKPCYVKIMAYRRTDYRLEINDARYPEGYTAIRTTAGLSSGSRVVGYYTPDWHGNV